MDFKRNYFQTVKNLQNCRGTCIEIGLLEEEKKCSEEYKKKADELKKSIDTAKFAKLGQRFFC